MRTPFVIAARIGILVGVIHLIVIITKGLNQ
jgi:hypothetical protein